MFNMSALSRSCHGRRFTSGVSLQMHLRAAAEPGPISRAAKKEGSIDDGLTCRRISSGIFLLSDIHHFATTPHAPTVRFFLESSTCRAHGILSACTSARQDRRERTSSPSLEAFTVIIVLATLNRERDLGCENDPVACLSKMPLHN